MVIYCKYLLFLFMQVLTVDGVVSVNGQSGSSTTVAGGGSGGGIHIECSSLVGYGVMKANGGAGYHGTVYDITYSE